MACKNQSPRATPRRLPLSSLSPSVMPTQTTPPRTPPMKSSNEAKPEQLDLARNQGDALMKALDYMAGKEAHGRQEGRRRLPRGLRLRDGRGLWHSKNGELVYEKPKEENAHLEIAVLDGADHRFVPGLTVHLTVIDSDGKEVGTHVQPFLWHPWIYHYGRNWKLPGNGTYTLHVRIEPPTFARHDPENGKRYAEPVVVTFENVDIKTGQK